LTSLVERGRGPKRWGCEIENENTLQYDREEGPISVFRIYHRGEKTRAGRNKRVVRLERGEVLGMGENKKGRDRRMKVDR